MTLRHSLSGMLQRLALILTVPLLAQADEQGEFFEKHVRPVLSKNCYPCHTASAMGGLRLDSRAALLKGGKSGPALKPGDPETSLMLEAVAQTNPKLKMPPSGKLTDPEIADLTTWIKAGAVWPESPAEFFTSKVQPIFSTSCYGCHAGATPRAGLHLDSREGMLTGGKSGPALKPGDPEHSLLLEAIERRHDIVRMPPTGPLPSEQVATIATWVTAGAVWPTNSVEPLTEYKPTPEQKAFWSFQPVKTVAVPVTRDRTWAANPIDSFILAKLEEKKLTPAAPASKRVLLRRATYDLTGLPPTPEELDAFLKDSSPQAYEKVIDKLLASPAYGERWGRHWLDVVRYSDTSGDNSDFPVPSAYRYRNYVIQSFQNDKPYDKFIREQIAGDLLQPKDEEARRENIIATGYLANARRFGSNNNEFHLTIEDTIDNTGKAFLGLSVSCARCHDHKFDPIGHRDYYAMYGIFNSTKYAFPGTESLRHTTDFAALGPPEAAKELRAWEKQLNELDTQFKGADRDRISGKITPQQANTIRSEIKDKIDKLEHKPPAVTKAYAVSEGKPGNSRIQRKGEPKDLGPEVPRGFLTILGGAKLPADEKGSGRMELANWIATPDNPLTARVMVNRVWEYHFGKGIVQSPNDFGVRGERPTHPELLDYLAGEFLRNGWTIKPLHRAIMLSRAYRMSSTYNEANARTDVRNENLWRFNRRRLDAEEIRDSILAVSDTLDRTPGGEHPFPPEYDWRYTQHRQFFANYETNRRSVYMMLQRIQKNPFMEAWDGPDTNTSTPVRANGTTAIQALFLLNDPLMHDKADALAVRVGMGYETFPERVQRAYQLVFGRPATPAEIKTGSDYVRTAEQALRSSDLPLDHQRRAALASYMRVLLSSDDFLFVD